MVVNLEISKKGSFIINSNNDLDYMVLDVKGYDYVEDKTKLKNAIEVLSVINSVHWANQFYKDANSSKSIPLEILYKCMNASFSNEPFTDDELTEYYKTSILIDDFSTSIMKFKLLENYTPYSLEYVLFGLSYDEQNWLTKDELNDLEDEYGSLFCDVRMRDIDVKDFIQQTKKLINDRKEFVLKRKNEKQKTLN